MISRPRDGLKALWREEKPLWLLVFLTLFVYSLLSVLNHLHFNSNAMDFGNFDQMVWHYSRFEAPACTQLGLANCLGDHFSPILALCAPLYWIYPNAALLLVAQAFLVALAAIPVFLYCRHRLGSHSAYLLTISFVLFWGIQRVIRCDLHLDIFCIPLIAFAIYFIDTENWVPACISIAGLLTVKEDLTLLVAFFGLYLWTKRQWALGGCFLIGGFVFFYLEVLVWVPHFHGTEGNYPHWYFTELGAQPGDSIRAVLHDPFLPLFVLFSHWEKIAAYLMLFGPFLFLPLLSPQFLLMVPLIAAKELASNPHMWSMETQYSAALCPLLVTACAEGMVKWRQRPLWKSPTTWPSAPWLVFSLCLLCLPFFSSFKDVEHARFWVFNDSQKASAQVFQLIPPDASVETQTAIAPHLTHRQTIYSLYDPNDCGTLDPDYFVACSAFTCYPRSYEQVEDCMRDKEKKGYVKIFEGQGWTVLKKPAAVQ